MTEKAVETFAKSLVVPGLKKTGGVSFSLPSMTGAADAFLAVVVAGHNPCVFVVADGIPSAGRVFCDIKTLAPRQKVLEYPQLDPDEPYTAGERIKAVKSVLSPPEEGLVIVASCAAAASPAPSEVKTLLVLRRGTSVKFDGVCASLADSGYTRVPTVMEQGTFSVRGGIIDIWSPGDDLPVRAEFFGDETESLRRFDPGTQLSVERVETAEILSNCGSEDTDTVNILSLLPENAVVIKLDHNAYTLETPEKTTVIYTGDPAPRGIPAGELTVSALPGFSSLGPREARDPELFETAGKLLETHIEKAGQRGLQIYRIDALSGGFETSHMIVTSKADRVFTKRLSPPGRTRAGGGERLSDFDSLEPGEYVVHVDHGIGCFIGSSEIKTASGRSEVFTVEYADGAKLHVPPSQAHLLSRYIGVKGESVTLHRLDGKKWAKDKKNAEKAVTDLAAGLLETQALRETTPGFAYDTRCEGLDAFEAAFIYEETKDQLAAIEDVKKDMGSPRPMDRLVCGDAGYGKTEVAMRAAYIAAMNGKQTVVLAPTTILAEQHFETFTARFDGTPVRIESLSRFQSRTAADRVLERLASGTCDIVIGTHAVLGKKVAFRDLGLIIIDEEQRFGVRQKELLKNARQTADVLTMSATPIPRTLYLAMTGARTLSLIRTPPRERVAVETRITRKSDAIIREAVAREKARGGQVFFLHNRISTLPVVEKHLRELLPEAHVISAHGRMEARELAKRVRSFERGEADILLSTTIVESGIDIPSANTILVDRADTLGMAELYQLRGRVGRSSRRGFAYFMIPEGGVIESDARERLDALSHNKALGAGFNLALRDLEIRGAGNLLGARQSGHIAAVGFNLYCKLLKRTIAMLKGEKPESANEARLMLDFIDFSPSAGNSETAAALTYDYIEEDSERLVFTRRIAEAADTESIKALENELRDRYGEPPAAAKRFLGMMHLKTTLSRTAAGFLDVKGSRAVFRSLSRREILLSVRLRSESADGKLAELAEFARQLCV